MLRIAILEQEATAKQLIFELGRQMDGEDWTFQYFSKISQFAKAEEKRAFPLLIFHDHYDTPRIAQSFITPYPQRVVVFTTTDPQHLSHLPSDFERVLYIDRRKIGEEIKRIATQLRLFMQGEEEYLFSYNHLQVPMKLNDIYYIEKEDKLLVYHTRKGKFSERKNMKDAEKYFERYQFLRIHASYLVNFQYITKIETDNVYVRGEVLPFARNRKKEVSEKIRSFIKK